MPTLSLSPIKNKNYYDMYKKTSMTEKKQFLGKKNSSEQYFSRLIPQLTK